MRSLIQGEFLSFVRVFEFCELLCFLASLDFSLPFWLGLTLFVPVVGVVVFPLLDILLELFIGI
jgi:hypothetical protein